MVNNSMDFILDAYKEGFKPPFSGSIHQWAEKYIDLQSGYSITGKFDCSISPHFKKIFDAYQDPFVREINILAPPRSGKTLISEINLLHTIAHNTGDILWLTLSDEKASQMTDLRMIPLLNSCEPVKAFIDTDKKYNIQTNQFSFLHSTVHITSPKENALNAVGYKYIFADEVWKYKGDAIINDIKYRTHDYRGFSKCSFFSQGGNVGSNWYNQYKLGDEWEYGFRCPKCQQLQVFNFIKQREDGTYAGIVWDKLLRQTNGEWDIKKCGDDAKLECFYCRYQITDDVSNRKYLLDAGDWVKVKTGDNPQIQSFRFNNLSNVKIPFAELVTRYLTAKKQLRYFGAEDDFEQFTTKDLADWWDPNARKKRVEIRLTDYDTQKPFGENEAFRFMVIDCQQTDPRFYYVIRAFANNGDSRMIAHGTCNTWKEVAAIRERHNVDFRYVGVDSGDGTNTEAIYSECVRYGRWANIEGEEMWTSFMSLKGSGLKGWMHSDKRWYRYNEPQEYFVASDDTEDIGKSILHVTWSNLRYKTILEALRDGKTKVKWEANDATHEYTNQMNSETLQRQLKNNKVDFEYVKRTATTANHFWDVEAMILVLADLFGCLQTQDNDSKSEANN